MGALPRRQDVAETNNLAAQEPARLIAMIGMWYNEAGKYNVLPIDSRGVVRIAEERPQIASSRNRYVLYPGTQSIPAGARTENPQSTVFHHRGGRGYRRHRGRPAQHGRQ